MNQDGKNSVSHIAIPLLAMLSLLAALWIGVQFVRAPTVRQPDGIEPETFVREPRETGSRPDSPPPSPSSPTPHPDLDEDWDSLPELVSEPTPATPPPTALAKLDRAELLAPPPPPGPSLPLPEAVWRAGILNGSPAHGEAGYSSAEYGLERTDAVLHIRDPAELPAFLHVGQRLVLHLPGLEPDLYSVHVATTGGDEGTPDRESERPETRKERLLSIRWNDRPIWRRWLRPVHAITTAAVPPSSVHGDSNQLTLENLGTKDLPLDAVWIQPFQRGSAPFYVAAERGEWLNRAASAWVKNVVVELPIPTGDFDGHALSETAYAAPALRPEDLEARWRRADDRFRELVEADHPAVPSLRMWHQRLGKAVARGMMPSIKLTPPPNRDGSNDLDPAFHVFGELVSTWFLPAGHDNEPLIDSIRSRFPDAQIVVPRADDPATPAWRNRYVWPDYQYWMRRARAYRDFFDGKGDEAELRASLNQAVNLRAHFMGYMGYQQAWHSLNFHQAAAEYLMASEHGLVIHGMHPGGPFFPAGNDEPALFWHFLKTLFRFGGPDHRKGVANLVGDDHVVDIGRAAWAVADNGLDSVQVLVHNHPHQHGQNARLSLPLPWIGPTRMVHHHTRSAWGRPPPPDTVHDRRALEPKPFTKADGSPGGWVSVPFEFDGTHLFEFRPADAPGGRVNRAPNTVGFSELIETDKLFDIGTTPPPPWWSRKALGAHFFPLWRHSGDVSFQVNVDATRDGATDWAALQAIHMTVEEDYQAVTPLRAKSTRFRFDEGDGEVARVLRASYQRKHTRDGGVMGLWIRANPPPDFKPEFDAFHAVPRTRFYMGKLPYRQLIDIEYGRWYFITSQASWWTDSVSRHHPFLVFWPADPVDGNPEIEVNSFEVYGATLEESHITPEKCLGFIKEDGTGGLTVLVLGVPGKPAFWRQRLPYLVDRDRLRHVVDRGLLTTAETPEEDPPEMVRHDIRILEDARLLEIEIERMPESPSPGHLEKIEQDFPLLKNAIENRGLGAFLVELSDGTGEER